jgi:hypothetical protein
MKARHSSKASVLNLAVGACDSYLSCDGKTERSEWIADRIAFNVQLDDERHANRFQPFGVDRDAEASRLTKKSVWKQVTQVITRFAKVDAYRGLGYPATSDGLGRFLTDQAIVAWTQWDAFYKAATDEGKALVESFGFEPRGRSM